jgi:hypothetical protein
LVVAEDEETETEVMSSPEDAKETNDEDVELAFAVLFGGNTLELVVSHVEVRVGEAEGVTLGEDSNEERGLESGVEVMAGVVAVVDVGAVFAEDGRLGVATDGSAETFIVSGVVRAEVETGVVEAAVTIGTGTALSTTEFDDGFDAIVLDATFVAVVGRDAAN